MNFVLQDHITTQREVGTGRLISHHRCPAHKCSTQCKTLNIYFLIWHSQLSLTQKPAMHAPSPSQYWCSSWDTAWPPHLYHRLAPVWTKYELVVSNVHLAQRTSLMEYYLWARNETGQFVNLLQPTLHSTQSAAGSQETKFLRHFFLKRKRFIWLSSQLTERIKDFHSEDKCQ